MVTVMSEDAQPVAASIASSSTAVTVFFIIIKLSLLVFFQPLAASASCIISLSIAKACIYIISS